MMVNMLLFETKLPFASECLVQLDLIITLYIAGEGATILQTSLTYMP